jgi:hypothetical protein
METQHCGFARDDVEGVVAGNLVPLRQLHFQAPGAWHRAVSFSVNIAFV